MRVSTQEIQQIKPSLSGLNKISIISHPFLVDQVWGADLSGSGHLDFSTGLLGGTHDMILGTQDRAK